MSKEAKAFFDTNVLVYACDKDTPDKQEKAKNLMRRHAHGNLPCISTQVLQEFYVSATRKLGIEPHRAKDIIISFQDMETALVDVDDIRRAIDGNIIWQISFWDALIIATARKLRCNVIYTEDLNHGQIYDSVQALNPFL
jgi:predicted nucleic acid-binding protein